MLTNINIRTVTYIVFAILSVFASAFSEMSGYVLAFMTLLRYASEELDMTHLERILDSDTRRRLDTPILLSLAREVGHYASILFCYLMEKQIEQVEIGDGYNLRQGRKWIPMLSETEIWEDLPIFPDVRTINRAADILEDAGYLTTERTGAFLDRGFTGFDGYYTGRARDKWTWWRVCKMPDDYTKRTRISALEAVAYGMTGAVILAHWRSLKEVFMADGQEYKKLSGAELEKVLPMDEKTARRQIRALMDAGALVQHPLKPKLYRMSVNPITAVPKVTSAVSVERTPKQPEVRTVDVVRHCEDVVGSPLMVDCHAA